MIVLNKILYDEDSKVKKLKRQVEYQQKSRVKKVKHLQEH